MSRSYRKYSGLNHTWSDTKQGKIEKKSKRRRLRRCAKTSEDALEEAKRCARGNCYDHLTDADFEYMAEKRGHGYSPKRVKHRLFGK